VLGPTIDRLAELAGDGRALELAIGTGHVAVPLAERGVPADPGRTGRLLSECGASPHTLRPLRHRAMGA
jgi:hypothetical protein